MYKSAPIPTSLAARWRRGFDTLAIAVALQHLGADGFLHVAGYPLEISGAAGRLQWTDDVGVDPQVELVHEITFLFGHMFCPFRQASMLWQRAACLALCANCGS